MSNLQSALWGTITASYPDIDPEIEYAQLEFRDKDLGDLTPFIGPQMPWPARVAYEGYEGDAYYLDGSSWKHCQTGEA